MPQWLRFKERALAEYSSEKLLFVRSQAEFDQVKEEARFSRALKNRLSAIDEAA